MYGTVLGSIIYIRMTEFNDSWIGADSEAEGVQASSDAVTLAVCGDPVVGRVLELLLRDFNYDVRCLPVSSAGEPGVLQGVRLMLLTLTPGLSDERRKALAASLASGANAGIPVLELVASEAVPYAGTWVGRGEAVPWPCDTQELKRRIEASLYPTPVADRTEGRD